MSEELHIVSMYVLILTQKAFFKLGIYTIPKTGNG